ncbi:MAG: AraC family transcriptional regulator [Eubacteriales bacterium]|nr:AraC family transcriptional regulator [Eubacteriales bacterium]
MAKPKPTPIEYRNYALPPYFPIVLVTGENWRISEVPSGTLHFHNCLEIGLCESDSGMLQLADRSHPFQEGDVTFIASDIPHTTYSSPGTASKWSYIFVNIEDLLSPYFPLEVISSKDMLQNMLRNYTAVLSRNDYPEVYQLVKSMVEEMKQKDPNFQFSVRGLMLSLITKLMNIYDARKNDEDIHLHENALAIAPALYYIRKNFMLDFPMDDLAALCNMSPSHFRRTFKGIMGFSAMDYTKQMRMKEASILLRTTEISILDISEEVGFHSLSSFNHHFMETFGMTPMKYRKQLSCIRDKSVLKCTGWLPSPEESSL